MTIELFVIYCHPLDYPDHYVVRRQFILTPNEEPYVAAFGVLATGNPRLVIDRQALLAETLDDARARLPRGLVRLNRNPEDDPNIVEVWI